MADSSTTNGELQVPHPHQTPPPAAVVDLEAEGRAHWTNDRAQCSATTTEKKKNNNNTASTSRQGEQQQQRTSRSNNNDNNNKTTEEETVGLEDDEDDEEEDICAVEEEDHLEEEEDHLEDPGQGEDHEIDMQSHLEALQVVCTAATNSASSEGEDGCSSSFNFHMENKHTQRKTDTDMRTLSSYLKSLNESRSPEMIPPVELDNYLSSFFMVVRKADGSEYEPKTLRAIMASIERYLRCRNYPVSITRDYIFSKTRDSLKEKQRILKEQGIGNKPRPPADPLGVLVAQRVNQLYAKQNMGPYNPLSVVSTLIFVFIVHFRLRKAVDHKNLLWGDIQLKVDKNGREYLVYRPQSLPSLPPHIENHIRRTYNIYAQPERPERDPVAIYQLYNEKRPASMKYSNSPFYLGIFSLNPLPFQDWYRASAMGINKLCDLVKQIRSITGLPRAMYAQDSPFLSPQFISNALMGPDPSKSEVEAAAALVSTNPHHDLSVMDTVVYNVDSDSESVTEQQSNMSFIGSLENQSSVEENLHGEDLTMHDKDDDDDDDDNGSHLAREDVFLTLEQAKEQFLLLLQRMDIDALVAFDKWLKLMRISRNPVTGKVICRENTVHSAGNSQTPTGHSDEGEDYKDLSGPTISGVYGSFPNTNITVNITLSPQALMGQGPITVTASTAGANSGGGTGASGSGLNASLTNGLRSSTQSSANTATIDLSQAIPSTSRGVTGSSTSAEERIHAMAVGSFTHSKSHSNRALKSSSSSHRSGGARLDHSGQPAFPIHLIPNNASYEASVSKKSRLDVGPISTSAASPTINSSSSLSIIDQMDRARLKRILSKPSSSISRGLYHGISGTSSSSALRHSASASQARQTSATATSTSATTTSAAHSRYVALGSKDGNSSDNSVIFIKQDPD
ncbi:unnamed protein product [Acanthosepion pharaonis]|uniref:ZMYM2-like/QRICH1 C-terminal domain-containing protein n=1 Tax=Acanthosepion pharaonis TaxID=158019 RepID=A0A812AU35_ACAPH|nr:unnamed protein product [Sepia pharaonis]